MYLHICNNRQAAIFLLLCSIAFDPIWRLYSIYIQKDMVYCLSDFEENLELSSETCRHQIVANEPMLLGSYTPTY